MKEGYCASINVSAFFKDISEMDADCVGWYTKLILHEFEKGSLPNSTEKLASLCGVAYSEYPRFNRVFQRYIKMKFIPDEENRLVHGQFSELVKEKKLYLDKRVIAGKKSYLIKFLKKEYHMDKTLANYVKERLSLEDLNLKNDKLLKKKVDRLLKEKNIILFKRKDVEAWSYQETLNTSRIDDMKFKEDVVTFFDQKTPTLTKRAMDYMGNINDYDFFKEQTEAYMEYKELTSGKSMCWRRYKTSWRNKDWRKLLGRLEEAG
ncbi:hypothetical protein [Wenyingzhuangia sp. IMCC45574]